MAIVRLWGVAETSRGISARPHKGEAELKPINFRAQQQSCPGLSYDGARNVTNSHVCDPLRN